MKQLLGAQLAALPRSLMEHRSMIMRLVQREILTKYRGSLFGVAWTLLLPLMMLAVYTFVFTEVFEARWGLATGNKAMFALAIFSGLVFYTFFAECALKAPGLMLANPGFINKVVFPLEVLPVVSALATLFNALASMIVLCLAAWVLTGHLYVTVPYAFAMLLPLLVICIGVGWLLSAVGVYIRDIGLIIAPITTGLLFLIPVLYPLSQVPERWRSFVRANPLTYLIESARGAILEGHAPDMLHYLWLLLGALVFAVLGFLAFNKARRGFADVV